MNPALIAFGTVLLALLAYFWRKQLAFRREQAIRTYQFPRGLFERLRKHHPHLSPKECQLVSRGLRQFFLAYLKSGRRFVSMPSQAVDDLWHEFILYTKNYEDFCQKAFGGFFHHTPAVVLAGGQLQSNAGLRRCWRYACREENINPAAPSRLPLLFALDAKLNIANGFHYVADCSSVRRSNDNAGGAACHCGGDFSDSSIDGSTSGLDDSGGGDGGDGDGGGDGGGCGGGCGGGD